MKLDSKPDDLCGNCEHAFSWHSGHFSRCLIDVPKYKSASPDCHCAEFVPPIVARLVEAVVGLLRIRPGHQLPVDWWVPQTSEERVATELLVEVGRVIADAEGYRWSPK